MKNSILLFILFISIAAFAQSPWPQKKGKAYTQLSFTTIPKYDTLFGASNSNTERETTDNTLQFYSEYGLTDKTTLLLNIPLKFITTNNLTTPIPLIAPNTTAGSKTALGNITFGVKHNFYKKEWLLSGQLSMAANTGSFDENTGIRTAYDAFTFTPLLLAGRSFGKTYIQSFIGANFSNNNYSSNFKIGAEMGRKITRHIWLIGFLDLVKSFKNGPLILPLTNQLTGLYVNDQEYGSFGLKGIGEFNDKFGITAGFGGAFFGNNVAKQAALTFGVYRKF
jgi:hypothetical protein